MKAAKVCRPLLITLHGLTAIFAVFVPYVGRLTFPDPDCPTMRRGATWCEACGRKRQGD